MSAIFECTKETPWDKVEPEQMSDYKELATKAAHILERAKAGKIDLRDVASVMGDKWDQDFVRCLLESATALEALERERDEARAKAKELRDQVLDLKYGPGGSEL